MTFTKKIMMTICMTVLVTVVAYATNEITANIVFKVDKGFLSYQRAINQQFTITNSSPNMAGTTQNITNNYTLITLGDIAVPGWAFFRNQSTTQTVSIGVLDGSANYLPIMNLKTGEYCLVRLGTNAIYAKPSAGIVILEKAIVDD